MGAEQTIQTTAQHSGRLSGAIIPDSYKLMIEPNMTEATFKGEETIALRLLESVDQIVINTAEISINVALLRAADGRTFPLSVSANEDAQQSTLRLDGEAPAGQYTLDLQFTGILNNKLRGFYLSKYTDAQGKQQHIATTKFEPSDARRAFPCFDEPHFKATFQVSLLIDQNLTAIANTKLISEELLAGKKKLMHFAPSIKMSSYLVAYMVGRFVASQPVISNDIEIRIWTVPGKEHLCDFALRWAKDSLDYFAKYFEKPYAGDKLDLIAIPDFASGAMENFGAITFRETALLVDETRATLPEKKRVAEVICHENAHMWFGDLVTMSWWNGLWLNEAFATFMAAKAVHEFMPSWKFWESFNIEKAGAMRIDGLHASRSIEFPVATPEDARAMFDVLTYEKGCAILRMLELYIGEEVFRKGCSIYMHRHAFANTETSDLWSALQEAVDEAKLWIPVGKMMDTWVFQQGFPLLTVAMPDKKAISISQHGFRYLAEQESSEKESSIWHIPVWVRSVAATKTESVYSLSNSKDSFELPDETECAVVNAGGKGFYRVNYESALLDQLLSKLPELTAAERFNLLADLWAATLAGEVSATSYLGYLEKFTSQETDVNVFQVALASLSYLKRIVGSSNDETQKERFKKEVSRLLTPVLDSLGWDAVAGEDSQNAELRASLVSMLGTMGDERTLERARSLWIDYLQEPTSLDPNLLPAVVDSVSANGDASLYEKFLNLKAAAKTPQEESRFLFALANFKQKELVERTLKSSLDGTIRVQDAPQMLRALLYNSAGGPQAWDFIKSNWDEIVTKLPLQGIIRLCDGLTALVNPELEADIDAFSAKLKVKGNEKALSQNLETLRIANRFLSRERDALNAMLCS